MLRINRRKMIGLLLLSVSAIVYVFALASGQDSIFEYTLLGQFAQRCLEVLVAH